MKEDDEYTFEQMMEKLESIKKNGEGSFSFTKALYCIGKKIQEIETDILKIQVEDD